MDISLRAGAGAGDPGAVVDLNSLAVTEHVTLHADLENVGIELATTVAMASSVKELGLGDTLANPLPCMGSALVGLNASYLNVTLTAIGHPHLRGFIDPGTDHIFNSLVDAAFLLYEDVAENSLPGFAQTQPRHDLNEWGAGLLHDPAYTVCPRSAAAHPPEQSAATYMDFQAANLAAQLPEWLVQPGRCNPCTPAWLVNEAVGVDRINGALRQLTKQQSGVEGRITLGGPGQPPLSESHTKMGQFRGNPPSCITCARIGNIHVEVANFTATGLASLASMDLLRPTDKHVLSNRIRLGGAGDEAEAPLSFSLDIALQVDGLEPWEEDTGFQQTLHIDDRFTLRFVKPVS